MKRIFEFIGGFAILAFSFYFTDSVSMLVANKSELMQEIVKVSSIYEEEAVDAKIDLVNSTIVPGKFGKTVNSQESYLEMHDFGSFNENYLVFDYIKPKKSLEDNKDLFITTGYPSTRKVNFIILDNDEAFKYFKKNDIPCDLVVKESSEIGDAIIINGASTKSEFNKIDNVVKNYKVCLKDVSNIELCRKRGYYLIDPKLVLTPSNLINIKNSIVPGSIILLSSGARLDDIKFLLNEIEHKDLKIVNSINLISEKESQ